MLKQVSLVTGKCILMPGLLKPGGVYYATYLPTVSRVEQAENFVKAAGSLKAAAFIDISSSALLKNGDREIDSFSERVERWKPELEAISGKFGVPVALGFSEANSAQWVELAMKAGCTSVTVDLIKSPPRHAPLNFEDNIRLTREAFAPAAGTNLTRIGVLPLPVPGHPGQMIDTLADDLQQFVEGSQVEAVVFDLTPHLPKETSCPVSNEPVIRILESLEKARQRCPQTPFILRGVFNAPDDAVRRFNSSNYGDKWVEGFVGLEKVACGTVNLFNRALESGLITAVADENVPDLVYMVALGQVFGKWEYEMSRGEMQVNTVGLMSRFSLVGDEFRRFLCKRMHTLQSENTVGFVQREDYSPL